MRRSGDAITTWHQRVLFQPLHNRQVTLLGLLCFILAVCVSMILIFQVVHSLGFMEGIAITTAYFISREQNTENTVPNQEINGDCETVGQNTTCLNKSTIYDDLGGLFAQAPNEDFSFRMSNSTPWNENNERQEFGVGSAISESASMGNNQNTTHLSSTGALGVLKTLPSQ